MAIAGQAAGAISAGRREPVRVQNQLRHRLDMQPQHDGDQKDASRSGVACQGGAVIGDVPRCYSGARRKRPVHAPCTLEVGFCAKALDQALQIAIPDIHNSDQGSQFTANAYLALLHQYPQIRISMDGRGRCFDNIFTERLWRSLKYEEVYLREYLNGLEARESIKKYLEFYNHKRLHQSLNYQTPAEMYFKNC